MISGARSSLIHTQYSTASQARDADQRSKERKQAGPEGRQITQERRQPEGWHLCIPHPLKGVPRASQGEECLRIPGLLALQASVVTAEGQYARKRVVQVVAEAAPLRSLERR